jgi:anoctamin-10
MGKADAASKAPKSKKGKGSKQPINDFGSNSSGTADSDEGAVNFDVVIIFPYSEGHGKGTSMPKYVNTLLGIRKVKHSDGVKRDFRDPNHAIFRSDRCFMNTDGTDNEELARLQADLDDGVDLAENFVEKIHDQKAIQMKILLEQEYADFTGSNEPCMRQAYCELVARSVSKRLQSACGLTTVMKYGRGSKGEKTCIIMGIKADPQDLRVQADRSNYRVQIHNKPFTAPDGDYSKSLSHKNAPTFNEMYERENPDAYHASQRILSERCDDSSDPSVDPGLFTHRSWQPQLRKGIRSAGHPTQECEGAEENTLQRFGGGMYLAPYADYRIDDHFQPFFRHYRGEHNDFTVRLPVSPSPLPPLSPICCVPASACRWCTVRMSYFLVPAHRVLNNPLSRSLCLALSAGVP